MANRYNDNFAFEGQVERAGRQALAFALVAWVTTIVTPAYAGVKVGDGAAELSGINDRSGKALTLTPHRGKIVVLTFGASWCKPCRKELPAYDKLAKAYKRAGADVVFVAVNIDSERANADAFLRDTKVSKAIRVGFDPKGGSAEAYEPGTMPTTYIIDDTGIVREVHAGYRKGDADKLKSKIDALRKQRKLK